MLHVCVCVHARACVYFYSFTVKGFSVCNDVWDILEGMDQRSCVMNVILAASVKFFQVLSSSFLKMSYFTLKDETAAADKLERKRYDVLVQRNDDIY